MADRSPDVPADVRAAIVREFPGATDDEVRELADLKRRFAMTLKVDAEPLVLERSQIITRIWRRSLPPLREPTPNEQAAIKTACDAWLKMSPDQQWARLQRLLATVLGRPEETYLDARGDSLFLMEQAGLEGDVEAFRILLCLSRGLDPTDGSTGASSTVDAPSRVVGKCRGGCRSFREGYVDAYWKLAKELGETERPTRDMMARKYHVHERTMARWLAGCPDRATKQPRHEPLQWQPAPPVEPKA